MKRILTTAWLACMLVALTAEAQPVRNGQDIIWARDVNGAEITLDGVLDEAVWQRAETIELRWDGDHPMPGSGQRVEGEPVLGEPLDPNDGTIYLLRDGNTLWLGADVRDNSVGGATGLWNMDGFIINILDRVRVNRDGGLFGTQPPRFNANGRNEFFVSWWNLADTTDGTTTYADGTELPAGRPLPGVPPRLHGYYGHSNAAGVFVPRADSLVDVWDVVTVVDGIANDDTHGEDVGYVIEMRVDMAALGYDFDQAGGDKAPWNIALQDADYAWPADPDINFVSRVWWQNQWGNNFNLGAAYIMGAPGVTVDGEAPEVTEPEFTVRSGDLFDHPEIDGNLDDPLWERVEPQFYIQYQADRELLDMNPTLAQHQIAWWRIDPLDPIVVDPSLARISMFHKDNILYVGVDVDDQAISGSSAEGGMDGVYLFVRYADSLSNIGTLWTERFDFNVDSTGAIRYGARALTIQDEDPTAVTAAVALKGSSTAADPTDVDEGYQIEIAINLTTALGYPEDLGNRQIWVAYNFLDGDFLESEEDSYAMRTWTVSERGGGGEGASIYGYLDPNDVIGVSAEREGEIPTTIQLMGNYPNPFNPTTTLRYALPSSGDVSVQVFNVLGQRVTQLAAGLQTAGQNELSFNAAGFASGVYFYQIQVKDLATGAARSSVVGRMILVK